MNNNFYYEEFIEKFEQAEMIVIGIGNKFFNEFKSDSDKEKLKDIIKVLNKKNYFIVTSCKEHNDIISMVNEKRIVQPLRYSEDISEEEKKEIEKKWDFYNKWLSVTLNKKLFMIELDEDFNNPNIFRWPFEKICFINLKSMFYRINKSFSQIPENISQKAVGITMDSKDFILNAYNLKKFN